jgi:uncharacterized protein YggE
VGEAEANVVVFGGRVQQANSPGGLVVSETLTVRVSNIDGLKDEELLETLIKVMDAAIDAGSSLPQGSSIAFKSSKIDHTRSAATADAMQAARRRAESLAGLAGAKIGPLVSVREGASAPAGSEFGMYVQMMQAAMDTERHAALVSTVMKPIEVTVNLEAEFELVGGR